MQITPAEIAETLAMVSKQHLDIRTITLGLNLRGCTDADIDAMARKVYDRMTSAAERLVPTAEQLEREFGIPIVNKRISITPVAELCAATDAADLTPRGPGHGPRGARRWASTSWAVSARLCTRGRPQPTSSSWTPSARAFRHRQRVLVGERGLPRAGINMEPCSRWPAS